MKRIQLKHIPLRAQLWEGWPGVVHQVLFGLFVAAYVFACAQLFFSRLLFGASRWPDGVLLVLATATTLASLLRRLPLQNVIVATMIIAMFGGAAHTLGITTGVPFGPISFTRNMGQNLFDPLPWSIPALWIVVILSSRGVARLILRPWRRAARYGIWVIGLTAVLVGVFMLGLEPFATQVKRFWLWQPSRTELTWCTAPWINFLGWAVVTVLILAFATPWLINKRPVKRNPPDFHPLFIWILLNLLFAGGAAAQRLWPAVITIGIGTLTVTTLALHGARAKVEEPEGA